MTVQLIFRHFTAIVLFLSFPGVNAQTLPSPATSDKLSCGAGNVILGAESTIVDPELMFDWYEVTENGFQLLGSVTGANGESQFITPFLIQSETFMVGIRLGDLTSPLTEARVIVENEISIIQAPGIELCGEVMLEANSTFEDTDIVSYQWQDLVAQENGEASFEDLLGSTSEVLTTSELGFYRVVISRNDGCIGISSEIEVTDDHFIHATPLNGGQHCFIVDNHFTHEVELSSDYGRDITTYLWEESMDGINFTNISTDPSVTITKPGSILTNTSVSYRLTVSEQNCSEVSDVFSIDWTLSPSGSITHTDPAIGTSDFFYCETDDVSNRTLEANPDPAFDVSIIWVRGILLEGGSLDFIKTTLRTLNPLDPLTQSFFQGFDVIGTGSAITLEEEDGGLIYAIFTDNVTGCSSYSSNAIFADTAFPFPISGGDLAYNQMNLICQGEGFLSFNSYDQSVDSYSWKKLSFGSFEEIGTEATLALDASLGSVGGTYRLEVVKNGCAGQSASFSVIETDPVEAIIQASNGEEPSFDGFTICPGEELLLSTHNFGGLLSSFSWTNGSGNVLGNDWFLIVSEAGTYFLEITNGACIDLSEPFVVSEDPIPSTTFTVDINDLGSVCERVLLELADPDDAYEYQWYFSENNLTYDPIADEVDSDYFISEPGHYFVEVTNSIGCSAVSDILFVPEIVEANTNFSEEAKICGASDHVLLMAESPLVSNTYRWMYSVDNVEPYQNASEANNLTYYQAFEEGYYVLEVSGEFCSAESTPVHVVLEEEGENESFNATISGISSTCLGSSIELNSTLNGEEVNFFWFSSTNGTDYLPVDGEITSSLSFNTDKYATTQSDEVTVFFKLGIRDDVCSSLSNPFPLKILSRPNIEIRNSQTNNSSDVFFCETIDADFSLEAFQTSTNMNLNYEWSLFNPVSGAFEALPNGGQKSYTPLNPGRYRCKAGTLGEECDAFSNEIDIISPPTIISGSSTFCLGAMIDLEVEPGFLPSSILESFTYQWFHSADNETFSLIDGETGATISIGTDSPIYGSGFYYFETTEDECTIRSDTFEATQDTNSFTVIIDGNTDQFKGVPFELEANGTADDIILFSWEPAEFFVNAGNERAVVTVPETYEENEMEVTVIVTSESGCSAEETIVIALSDVPKTIFSKLLTPNGDGLNDEFRITGLDESVQNKLRIFDSWGHTVYETLNYYNESAKSAILVNSVKDGIYYFIFTENGNERKGSFYVKK